MKVINFILDYWPLIGSLLYEICVRLWPTEKNRSLIDNIWKIFNQIIPNIRKRDGKETIVVADNGAPTLKNYVKASLDRHVLKSIILLLFISNVASAQIWQNFKGIRLVNQLDSTQVLSVDGSIYYNEQSKKFRCMENGVWKDCIASGTGGTSYTSNEGITLTGSNFTWGGSIDTTRLISSNNGSSIIFGDSLADYNNSIGGFNVITREKGLNFFSQTSSANAAINCGLTPGNYFVTINGDDGSTTGFLKTADINGSSFTIAAGVNSGNLNESSLTLSNSGAGIRHYGASFNETGFVSISPTFSAIAAQSGIGTTSQIQMQPNNTNAMTFTIPSGTDYRFTGLSGVGTRMVTVSPTGDLSAQAIPSGITNSAANNEMMKSDGTNAVGSGIYSTTNGDQIFGNSSMPGHRTISTDGDGSGPGHYLILSPDGSVPTVEIGNSATPSAVLAAYSGDAYPRSLSIRTNGGQLELIAPFNVTQIVGANRRITFDPDNSHIEFPVHGPALLSVAESISTIVDGQSLTIEAGDAYPTTGNGNGGDLILESGRRRVAGTGVDGNISVDPGNGFIVMPNLPTSCAGAPSGALWNDNNVLSICP